MPTLLFVCTGNYYRSRYAELYFNGRVPKELGWKAESRGFEPSPLNPGPINADVLGRIREAGMLPEHEPREPKLLTDADLAQADWVIALDEVEHASYVERMYPDRKQQFTYWRVADLHAMTVPQALGAIEQLVDEVIGELQGENAGKRKGPQ